MQSQQKRVKWSRGETAEALEERTDTGITMASVERMQDCIPDIYGNISRRPGLKVLQSQYTYGYGFAYDEHLQVFPFYISENDIVLIGVHFHDAALELIRIKDNIIVYKTSATAGSGSAPQTGVVVGPIGGVYAYHPVSFAQQNNYMLIADSYNVYKLQIAISTSDNSFTPTLETWKFSAGWYAPNGTKTKSVSAIPYTQGGVQTEAQLAFTASTATNYTWTDSAGNTTDYIAMYVGFGAYPSQLTGLQGTIPVGSIVHMPNIGCYMRIEGYFGNINPFPDTTFDGVINANGTVPSTGTYCKVKSTTEKILQKYINGDIVGVYTVDYNNQISVVVKNSGSNTGYSRIAYLPESTHFPTVWTNSTADYTTSIWAFGSLLTPIADATGIDNTVSVEYGYTSLQPASWNNVQNYPHPKKLVFNDQRLWAGAWSYSAQEEYSIVLGSQIARYNDLKNDYNQENEPITLDILTQFKERILHLIDYNGLKIMTDSFEYAYEGGGVVKQSANGSFEYCEPIVFDSLCLYLDTTGCQVKAMQYEFQSNIFNSTTINQVAPHDLVWYPTSMAAYEDKTNSTGKYLFLVNRDDADARLAVCNFVPGNQANIWNRWTFPMVNLGSGYNNKSVSLLHSVVQTKNHPIFMLTFNMFSGSIPGSYQNCYIMPAVIDFTTNTDTESAVYTAGGGNYYSPFVTEQPFTRLTLPNTTVAVYADGVFQFMDTTTSTGALTKSLEGLTNVTVGLPINAMVVSHPIDVGGKTKSIKKRIGKAQMSVHNTDAGAIIINGKTGYMNPAKDHISFYGVTGMKNEIKYTLTNNNGAAFHLESLLMNIEYGTLDS